MQFLIDKHTILSAGIIDHLLHYMSDEIINETNIIDIPQPPLFFWTVYTVIKSFLDANYQNRYTSKITDG